MKKQQIKSIRIQIKEAEIIEEKAHYPGEKIAAGYLIRRLKNKLLNLVSPQPGKL